MPRRKAKKSHGLATLVVVSLALILAATVGGLYVFGPGSSRGAVAVSIDGPSAVTSGDEVTYAVTVANADAQLDVADLTLEYPVGFLVTSVNPPATNAAGQSLFNLAPLAPGETATVTIRGRLLGAVGTAAEVRARLDYEPVNFSSSFRADAAAVTSIAAGRVHLTFDAPAVAVSPGQLAMSIAVENVAEFALNEVEVVLEVPEGITATSSTPPLANGAGELRYDLGSLEPGATWRAQVAADIVGDSGARRGIAVAVYQRIGGQRVIVERALREVEVVQPSATVALYVNQSTSSPASVPAGGVAQVAVEVRNVGSVALEQLNLQLRAMDAAFDLERATGDGWRVSPTAGLLQIDLPDLAPGEAMVRSIGIPVRGDAQLGASPSLWAAVGSVAYGEDWLAGSGSVSLVIQ